MGVGLGGLESSTPSTSSASLFYHLQTLYFPSYHALCVSGLKDFCMAQEGVSGGRFAPKEPPKLDPPKDRPISIAELAQCDGKNISTESIVEQE